MSMLHVLSRIQPAFEMSADFGHSLPVALTQPPTFETFDYADLLEDVANEARAAEDQIRAHGASVFVSLVAIGRTLLRMKERLGHGHFRRWITVQLKLSPTHAHRAMRYAAGISDAESSTVEHLPFAILDKLFAPSFPADARDDIMNGLASETPPDKAVVREQVEKAKPSKPKPNPVAAPEPVAADPIEATPAPVAPQAAEEAPQEPATVELAAYPVIEPGEAQKPPAAAVEAVKAPATEPVQIEPRPPVQMQPDDIGPAVFKLAEDMHDTVWPARILELAAQIGDDALGRCLCRALRGERVDDIATAEAGEATRPF